MPGYRLPELRTFVELEPQPIFLDDNEPVPDSREPRVFGVPRTVLALSATHGVNDVFMNIYAPLLPMFILRMDLSLTAAGVIAAAIQIAGSIAQLVFGPLADRWRPRMLAVIGPLVAVGVMSLAGLATTPLMLGDDSRDRLSWQRGVSPDGGGHGQPDRRRAARHGHVGARHGRRDGQRDRADAVRALRAGLRSHADALARAAGAGPALYWILRRVPDVRLSHGRAPMGFGALRPYAMPLALLWSAVVVRTMVAIGYSTFLPVLMTRRGLSISEAGFAVGAYLVSGSIGGLAGGPLADRFGPRRIIAGSLALSVPLLLAALVVPGVPGLLLLTVGGFFLGSTLPVNIAYAHVIAPVATGTVSSLMLGVAWGVGGLAVPLVGMIGDAVGLQAALLMLGVLPALAAVLTLRLPERASHV